jgi:hypothetical protein
MTKALAIEMAPHLVRVNAVCPADIMTPMLQYQADTYGGGDPEGYFKRLLASYFQGDKARFITPEEVAELIFFLASPPATPITGANISIDFGTSAGTAMTASTGPPRRAARAVVAAACALLSSRSRPALGLRRSPRRRRCRPANCGRTRSPAPLRSSRVS